MDATTPGPLDPGLLEREDVRRALAEHDFAAAFALIKKYGGLSQNRIAAACELTPGKVSTIINGRHQVTSFEVVRRIADGLRIPGTLLGLAPRPWETQETKAAKEADDQPATVTAPEGRGLSADEIPWRPDTTVGLAAQLTRSDLVMDRRTAARALAGAALTGTSLLDPLEGWLQPAARAATADRRRGRLGRREVEELETTARAFRAWDHKYGGGLRRKAVLGQLSEVTAHLDEHQTPHVEQRLYRVMAQLAGTAATMAWDSGLQRRAQEYYLLALRASHAGGDPVFGANVLAGMARQMLCRDQPQDALELVRLAQDGTRDTAGPRVRAMLHTREAWAYAAMGRTAAFRRATAQAADSLAAAEPVGAEGTLGPGVPVAAAEPAAVAEPAAATGTLGSTEPGTEPYWIAYFDQAELAGTTGGRLLELARQNPRQHAEAAAAEIRSALARRGPEAGRSHALDRIGLAQCHFLLGDLTTAAQETHHAVDAARATRSARVRSQLGELYPYTVGNNAARPVREARDRIRDLLAN